MIYNKLKNYLKYENLLLKLFYFQEKKMTFVKIKFVNIFDSITYFFKNKKNKKITLKKIIQRQF